MDYTDQDKIEKTFKFFDMAAVHRMIEDSNDLALLTEADEVEFIDGEDESEIIFSFSRAAMDSHGYRVGSETCRVSFVTFNAEHMMYVNEQKKKDYPMHGIGIDFDLSTAEFELEPAREEISWEEIFLENCPEYADHLQTYKESESVNEPIDEEDFCAYLSDREIHIDREDYFDPYFPADEDFWFQELEQRFDKLKDELRRTHWKFNPSHEEQEIEPWELVTESKQSSSTP